MGVVTEEVVTAINGILAQKASINLLDIFDDVIPGTVTDICTYNVNNYYTQHTCTCTCSANV